MTTDFRALCAELTEQLHQYAEVFPEHNMDALVKCARAALADEPAVPQGREPASVTGQPSDQELLDIAASTIEPYECSGIATNEYEPEIGCAVEAYGSELIAFARAVLARWGDPVPEPPADGEVAELVAVLRKEADAYGQLKSYGEWSSRLARAAELLQRQALVPVSVSERLPGDQLCWWFESDEEGDAYGSSWTLLRIRGGVSGYTHWLPAHALPVPEVGE